MSTAFIPGTVKPEEKYERMVELSRMLGIPVPEAHLAIASHTPDEELVGEYSGRSRTWNRNFWNTTMCMVTGAPVSSSTFGEGSYGLKNTGGSVTTIQNGFFNGSSYSRRGDYLARSSSGDAVVESSAMGIWIGTGSAAESFEGHALASSVPWGTGNGQASRLTMGTSTASYTAGTKKWTTTVTQVIHNLGTTEIVVREVGIIPNGYQLTSANQLQSGIMVCRDLLPAPVTLVGGGGRITITYNFSMTFPA
jgi:hypothetical protein